MLSKLEQHVRVLGLLSLAVAVSACKVDFKDGVFACATTSECPTGLRCDSTTKRCTRGLPSAPDVESSGRADAGPSSSNTGSVSEPPKTTAQAGRDSPASDAPKDAAPKTDRSDAGPGRGRADAGSVKDAGAVKDAGSATEAGSGSMPIEPGRAGGGGRSEAAGGAGAGAGTGQARAAAQSGAGGSAAECAQGTYCYGFEGGALDPSGALWPSPSGANGELPPYGELSTTTYPSGSQNKVLVSRPSNKDGWPKATVGFSGPVMPFSKLEVSFDYVAGDKLVDPNPRVILFRFVGVPDRNGDSVNVGLLNHNAMLEVQTDGPDPLTVIGPATAPGSLTHVVATFTRAPPACNVEVAYGSVPLTAAPFPCDVQHWNVEIGLDMLETPPEQYTQDYSAFFDNLRVSSTP